MHGWRGLAASKRAPPSPSAREQFRDGTGEAPSLVFLYRVPGASIRGLPGIALLCGGARASVSRKGIVMAALIIARPWPFACPFRWHGRQLCPLFYVRAL